MNRTLWVCHSIGTHATATSNQPCFVCKVPLHTFAKQFWLLYGSHLFCVLVSQILVLEKFIRHIYTICLVH